ncbi:MAG: hypothetical protein SP1CHLAM54_07690 [Chlamydiia bacterium]|nr:hypothetical protein [Chlamydiia bacterium]MCH9615675.1 hypothetical protein [Chlamydiia bacterium]MCH9628922.1 hypothetical protein [Chlamydiia bacterium]
MKREQWRSRIGFIWAAVGSAVGLGSIWRFPYVVGENGGATFILLYLICLLVIGFPVLMTEISLGRKAQLGPFGAFRLLGKTKAWGMIGKMTVITGFLVSSFYGVISGLTLGYLVQAIQGHLINFHSGAEAIARYKMLSSSPTFMLVSFVSLMILCMWILGSGVKKGIEAGNKIMMPLLLLVLIGLAAKGLSMQGGIGGLKFMFKPNWSLVTPAAVFMALGQAFFSLSLGQGTMVTYGSYVKEDENLPTTCIPITVFGIFVSILAGLAIFTIVFAMGLKPTAGSALMFETLPLIFSELPGGYVLSVGFFVLIFLAAVSSQISAMEPMIAYLKDHKGYTRIKSVIITGLGAFIVGVPCALSLGAWKSGVIFGKPVFSAIEYLCINILIPLGALSAVILVAWRWGIKKAVEHMKIGTGDLFDRYSFFPVYLKFSIKYLAPTLIVLVMLDLFGIFAWLK